MIKEFIINELYSNNEIFTSLKVANAGGIRTSIDNNIVRKIVLMTSAAELKINNENPYHDRVEDDILIYTAAGKYGEQTLSGINSRVIQQLELRFPIYCFEIIANRRNKKVGPKRWRFVGLLQYLRHFKDTQIDVDNNIRKVWVFEFFIHRSIKKIPLNYAFKISNELIKDSKLKFIVNREDREIISTEVENSEELKQIEIIRSKLLAREPRDFELFVKDLLIKSGFNNVCVTKYSQDGGVDVIANTGIKMWLFEKILVQIQAKRWLHSVGRKEVAELRGSLKPYARGVIVTTSYFSRAAINEAEETGKNPIGLIDGFNLSKIVLNEKMTI